MKPIKQFGAGILAASFILNPLAVIAMEPPVSAGPQNKLVEAIKTQKVGMESLGINKPTHLSIQNGQTSLTKNPESVGRVDTEEIKESLGSIRGLKEESDTLSVNSDALKAVKTEINGTKVKIPRSSNVPVRIESEGVVLDITLPEVESAREAEEIANGVVAYASQSDFANAVQATEDGGVRMTTIIDNPNAPTEYVYEVTLPEGGYIEVVEEGAAIVYDGEENGMKYIHTPWANDADGKKLNTWFTVDGLELTQHVQHNVEGVVYPVVADPWWAGSCNDYVVYSWEDSWNNAQRINAVPTACGEALARNHPYDSYHESLWKAGTWASGHNYWSMYYQWKCHADWGIMEDIWNVEAARPVVSDSWSQFQSSCNP